MTTRHTSRKGSLSLSRLPRSFSLSLRRPSSSSFSYVAHRNQGTWARYTPCMPPFTYSLLSTLPDLLLLFYSFTLRFPRRFLLSSFFGTVSPAVELLRERREKVIRCSSYDRRRWGMKYVPGSYISPNFAEYALQSRMKRYVEIGALCCASCRSFKKKKI